MSQSLVVYLLTLLQYLFLLPLKDRRSSRRGFSWMTMLIVPANLAIHALLTLNVFFPDWPEYHTWETLYPFMKLFITLFLHPEVLAQQR